MNSTEPEEADDDDDQCCNISLNFSAAKLDVYQHERLAYTEPARRRSASKSIFKRKSVLRAMAYWALCHF
jgi:hypothetical protein